MVTQHSDTLFILCLFSLCLVLDNSCLHVLHVPKLIAFSSVMSNMSHIVVSRIFYLIHSNFNLKKFDLGSF